MEGEKGGLRLFVAEAGDNLLSLWGGDKIKETFSALGVFAGQGAGSGKDDGLRRGHGHGDGHPVQHAGRVGSEHEGRVNFAARGVIDGLTHGGCLHKAGRERVPEVLL